MGSGFPTYQIRFVLFHRYLFNSEWLSRLPRLGQIRAAKVETAIFRCRAVGVRLKCKERMK